MKKIKSYTKIWNVQRVIYAINDLTLPFPITSSQMIWFTVSFLFVILFADYPPLCFIDGALLKYLGIPLGITWIVNKRAFDGKKPYNFLKSVFMYLFRPKVTHMGKPVKRRNESFQNDKILVRSVQYGVSN